MKISILIPCFNEVNTISTIINRVDGLDFGPDTEKEIIIVDDGSTDGCREILKELEKDNIKAIFHPKNSGKGGALRTGINISDGDIVAFQDADLELDPIELTKLVSCFSDPETHAVYGSRFLSGENSKASFKNRSVNMGLNMFFNILYGTSLTDLETGHKAFRGDVIRSLNLKSSRFDIEVEISAKLARKEIFIKEIPINYSPRTASQGKKMSYMKEGARAVAAIVRHRISS